MIIAKCKASQKVRQVSLEIAWLYLFAEKQEIGPVLYRSRSRGAPTRGSPIGLGLCQISNINPIGLGSFGVPMAPQAWVWGKPQIEAVRL